ncbi:MAG: hypothetical protein QE285_16580 [Aquabacterium sp.]|nr:hypothetical protein [Aquabacterium sp.]
MYIVPIAWMFVVVLMTVAEATSSQGTVLGAFFTFVLYGLIPLAILMYVLGTPARWRARRRDEAAAMQAAEPADSARVDGDGSGHPPGARGKTEREEP